MRCLTTEQFIEKAKLKHGDLYDYSLVEYLNSRSKIEIICPEHGIFEQTPNKHLIGRGCSQCNGGIKITQEDFIENAKKKHRNKYDYSLVNYVNNKTEVKIICTTHGVFEQKPGNHLKGDNCPECRVNKKLTTKNFIEKASVIHDNFYDYSLVDYINAKTVVKITCPEHGIFEQSPDKHLYGRKCKKCANKDRRLKTLDRIQKNMEDGYQITPNFNKEACEIFNKISKEKGIHIQHAMNGGEHHLSKLGYWLDGYDIINNVVYEYDEKSHKYQVEKDLTRENEIKDHLNCSFIRIKQS